MKKTDSIYIAGHKGLVGSSVLKVLKKNEFNNLITVDRKRLDLRNSKKVQEFFKNKKIDYMVMAAAKAGGIIANSTNQKDFFLENIEIQNSLLNLALKKKIKRTIYLGTSCIYPKFAKTPIQEDSLLTGKLEKTNQCYAIAKIAGIKFSETLYEDHKLDIIGLMPTNVYGLNDNFDKVNGHVIPAMITKFVEAKKKQLKQIKLLGTGKPIREFIHSDDLAEAIVKCLNTPNYKIRNKFKSKFPLINVGTGEFISILNLSKLVAKYVNFKGKILFNKNFPDGTFKKNLNSSKIYNLGWRPKIKLKDGLKEVINLRLN
ncbi:MAG: GDP-L-fucose synthase [Alphaproteobacteria bacterium MarineAlpha5_Bin5]|nr:MAG: GDP-L-fucose synthase [Alphaproteobacteria bacterium MarineAlpha5_Bin5]|tara:strand:+ start:4 stop:951 length:948 start_codon:yes stop_codon:yes gene_type:complete